jgi:hypothetical protein
MNFSIGPVWIDPAALPALVAFITGYLVAAVFAARRYGARGLWAAWAAATLVGAATSGEGLRNHDPMGFVLDLAVMAVPAGICALAIARTSRRPGVRKRVQLLLGGVAFVLALPLAVVLSFAAAVAGH